MAPSRASGPSRPGRSSNRLDTSPSRRSARGGMGTVYRATDDLLGTRRRRQDPERIWNGRRRSSAPDGGGGARASRASRYRPNPRRWQARRRPALLRHEAGSRQDAGGASRRSSRAERAAGDLRADLRAGRVCARAWIRAPRSEARERHARSVRGSPGHGLGRGAADRRGPERPIPDLQRSSA